MADSTFAAPGTRAREYIDAYLEGLNASEVATRFQVSKSTVQNIVKKAAERGLITLRSREKAHG